jgi:hypothetical protein
MCALSEEFLIGPRLPTCYGAQGRQLTEVLRACRLSDQHSRSWCRSPGKPDNDFAPIGVAVRFKRSLNNLMVLATYIVIVCDRLLGALPAMTLACPHRPKRLTDSSANAKIQRADAPVGYDRCHHWLAGRAARGGPSRRHASIRPRRCRRSSRGRRRDSVVRRRTVQHRRRWWSSRHLWWSGAARRTHVGLARRCRYWRQRTNNVVCVLGARRSGGNDRQCHAGHKEAKPRALNALYSYRH